MATIAGSKRHLDINSSTLTTSSNVDIGAKLFISTTDTNTTSTTALVLNSNEVEARTLGSNAFTSYTDHTTQGYATQTWVGEQNYLTSVAFSDLSSTPTTISGYGITDAFDGAYSSLSGTPTLGTAAAAATTDFATATQGATADAALPKAGGTVTGNILLQDSVELRFGTDTDLKMYHTGTDGRIANNTGHFYIQNLSDDKDIYLRTDDGSGGLTTYLTINGTYERVDISKPLLVTGDSTVSGATYSGGDLTIGNGITQSRLIIKKADNNVSNHIEFYNGTTLVGEIGVEDTSWLRINQETATNIYTPRYIRADAGFFVDGTSKGIDGSGNFIGGTITGASDANVSNWDTAYTHSQSAHAPSNAQANVQSDWNATSGDALILNKPTLGTAAASAATDFLAAAGNLGDLTNAVDARANLGLGTAAVENKGYFASASHTQAWSTITSTPTTLSGYGITDALSSIAANSIGITELDVTDGTAGQVLTTDGNGVLSFATVSSGGTDTNYYLDGVSRTTGTNTLVFSVNGATNQSFTFGDNAFTSYSNHESAGYLRSNDDLDWGNVINTPTTLAGYGITDAFDGDYSSLANLPTLGTAAAAATTDFVSVSGDTMTGHLLLQDSKQLQLGTDTDFILYHSGIGATIKNSTGNVLFENHSDDGDIIFKSDDGSGGVATYFYLDGGATNIKFDKSTRHTDNAVASFGISEDLKIYHDGTNSYIDETGTGNLYIRAHTELVLQRYTGETMLKGISNGAVELYYDNAKKLETTSTGVSVTGAFTASGDVTAFSDIRVKENIQTIPNALESVCMMRGVTYNKIGSQEESVGVVAQEIKEIMPQLVKENEDGMLSVAYGNITGVLIEAIKEQQKQIEELKTIIDGITK